MNEQPPDAGHHPEESIWMESRAFIAGDLSFFGTILGKENMAGAWCTWCTLSKAQWSAADHRIGEPWTIEKILDIRRNVEENNLPKLPEILWVARQNLYLTQFPFATISFPFYT